MERIQAHITHWLGPLRGRLMVAFVLIVGMYFVLSFGEQAWRSQDLQANVDQRQDEIDDLRDRRDDLAEQVSELQGEQYNTYVEQVARRDLNLAYPGETVLLVRWDPAPEQPAADSVDTEQPAPSPNWRQWMDFLTGRD